MTEAQWRACRTPDRLLDYHTIKTDPRRVRLLVAGCVRLTVRPDDPPLVAGVLDAVERYASGDATRAEFLAAWRLMHDSGMFLGPLAVGGVAAVAPLGVAAAALGAVSCAGAATMHRFIPRFSPWPAR